MGILRKLIEIIGDRDVTNKRKAKLKAQARNRVKCPENSSPHIVGWSGDRPIYKCKPKDKEKSRKISRIRKKLLKTTKGKKSIAKAIDTRKFRYKDS